MTSSQIDITYNSVIKLVLKGKLKLAFDKTRLLIIELQRGEFTDEFENLLQHYQYMLEYFMRDMEDPERKSVYNKLIARLIDLNAALREELKARIDNNFEYSQKRYFPHQLSFQSINDLYDSIQFYHQQKSLSKLASKEAEESSKKLRSNYEKLVAELFAIYWLSTTYNADQKTVFTNILSPDYPESLEQSILVSAITMNLWRRFDQYKVLLLLDICEHNNMQVKQRALVGLLFILTKYNAILHLYPSIRNRLVLLSDDSNIYENLKNIILLIIGTTDTERITKKMQEEIIPEMIKISPIIKDKMDAESLINQDEWDEENPEWADILEQSGIADKLQEITELQMEGADVYMSTFSMLKNFSFFQQIAHWFMPFDPEVSDIQTLFYQDDEHLMGAFLNNAIICNSDKYSFCLSILQMPASQRSMMSKSFKMESKQMEEITKDENLLKPDLAARNTARQYIQDLYRFFRLHPSHHEFEDMFDWALELHKTHFFEILSANSDIKLQTAEYYFNQALYPQAIELYEALIAEIEPSAALYQKLAYAYQKTSQFKQALDAYIKADLILPDDIWTVKKIAVCYRLLGEYDKAIDYYQHADFLKPGEFNTNMQIANCLIQLEKYKAALQIYTKIQEKNPNNPNLWRAISWTAFLAINIHQADYYMEKILSEAPTHRDYINAGHIALAKNNKAEALSFYKKSVQAENQNLQLVFDYIEADKLYLLNNDVDLNDLALILDQLSFSLDEDNT